MRSLLNSLVRAGLDFVFGKPDMPEQPQTSTSRCPNCLRPL